MMKLRVKLGSALPDKFPGYDSQQGLDIDIADDATVQDLLDYLQLTESDKCAVAIEGRIVKGNYKLKGTTSLSIFQVAHGG
jgi:sulfur carrier protein ThiS